MQFPNFQGMLDVRARRLIALSAIAIALTCTAMARATQAGYERVPFGVRALHLGDRGTDVKTLNWGLRAEGRGAPYAGHFLGQTDLSVRSLQGEAGIPADGVVARPTMKAIAARIPNVRASWYGPGLWGRRTACGIPLKKGTLGIAHRRLPCGTRVVLAHAGHWRGARVIDRGPYRKGYKIDLTRKLAKRLGVLALGRAKVKLAVVP